MTRLALVMIVRNEERSLARCLESARSSVDRIVVMDTGSQDRTVEIARSFGAEVHQMEWPNDFAAARNAALEKSDADWNVILDADEWFASGLGSLGPQLLPPLGDAPPSFVGCIRVADAGEDAPIRNFIPRVLPRGVRYDGRVHEQPITPLPRKILPSLVLHDGYDEAQLHRKKGRNENLLRAELSERPDNVYLQYQLGRQYLLDGDNRAAAECLVASYNASTVGTPFRHGIVIYTILALRWSLRYDEALELVDAEHDNWDSSPDFYFAVAELYLEWARLNIESADQLLPVAEAAWLKCLKIGEQPGLDGSVEGSGSFRAAENLANYYRIMGDSQRATHFADVAADMRQLASAA